MFRTAKKKRDGIDISCRTQERWSEDHDMDLSLIRFSPSEANDPSGRVEKVRKLLKDYLHKQAEMEGLDRRMIPREINLFDSSYERRKSIDTAASPRIIQYTIPDHAYGCIYALEVDGTVPMESRVSSVDVKIGQSGAATLGKFSVSSLYAPEVRLNSVGLTWLTFGLLRSPIIYKSNDLAYVSIDGDGAIIGHTLLLEAEGVTAAIVDRTVDISKALE